MGWISGNRWLNDSEMENNAKLVYSSLTQKGWSLNAIAGILGNMQQESTINPGIWQSLIVGEGGGGGWGLVQWTPWTNFTEWADSNGYAHDDGEAQLIWIDTVTTTVGQWIPTSTYPMSFAEFKVSTGDVGELAYCFMYNFERPFSKDHPERKTYAQKWYTYFQENGEIDEELVKNQDIIDKACSWAIEIANDDTHGYDQGSRWSPDYDCSSLVIQAYENAGSPVKTHGATYTGNMEEHFTACGFEKLSGAYGSIELIKGDVLLAHNDSVQHTALYIGDGKAVAAHINEYGTTTGGQTGDQTGNEIDVYDVSSHQFFNIILRLPSSGSTPTTPTDPPDPPDPPEPPTPTPRKMSKMPLLLMVIATD